MARIAIVFCLLLVVAAAASRKKGSSSSDGKIVGGRNTDISEVPYQVSLHIKGKHDCGGAIIGKKHVLTAAHCVVGGSPSDFSVRVGSNYHAQGGQQINVKTVVTYPSFNTTNGDGDLAVLVLRDPITHKKAKTIPLAESEPQVSEEVLISGWGSTEEGGQLSDILQSVTVRVIDKQTCRGYYRDYIQVTDTMFCAGYLDGRKDACKGDSGGPAVVNKKLAGVVSWGKGCAKPRQPGVYVTVSKFLGWIRQQIQTK